MERISENWQQGHVGSAVLVVLAVLVVPSGGPLVVAVIVVLVALNQTSRIVDSTFIPG